MGYEHKSGYEKTMQKKIWYEKKGGTKILVTKKMWIRKFWLRTNNEKKNWDTVWKKFDVLTTKQTWILIT